MANHPDEPRFLVQRAYLLGRMGRREEAVDNYYYAIGVAPKDRHVRWSFGWTLFNFGDYRAALEQWREAERLHGGKPFWLPYTYAIAYWALGEKATALAYYEAAARTFPLKWGTVEAARQATRFWKSAECSLCR